MSLFLKSPKKKSCCTIAYSVTLLFYFAKKVFLNQQQVWMGLDGARGVAMAAICQMNRKRLISVFDLTAHAHM